jgi:REP element-mobilizing transposase RayT
MARRPRVFVEGALYHVYNRFARGEGVFGDPEEAIEFVERLREVKARDGFVVFAWALLTNHYHVALRASAVPLSRTMQFLQCGFSRDFNRRWRRTGPLWQCRYKAKLIDEPEYLSRVINYIHLNPIRAGLTEDPSKYTFSGHRELMGKIRRPLCDVDEALLCFGRTVKSARRAYASGMKNAMKDDGLAQEVGKLPWWGHDRELDLEEGRPYIDVLGRSTGLERPHLEAEEFVTLATGLLDIEVSRLASKRQDSSTGRLRRMVASCGIERWGQRAGRLARVLCKHPVVVSRWVSEGNRLREEDQEFSAALEALDKALSVKALAQPRTHRRSTRNRAVNPRIQRAGDQES